MSFAPRQISVPQTEDGANNWPAWRAAMIDHVKLAETETDLSEIIDLNRYTFADCCERAPNAYRAIDETLDRRRRHIRAGLPWSEE